MAKKQVYLWYIKYPPMPKQVAPPVRRQARQVSLLSLVVSIPLFVGDSIGYSSKREFFDCPIKTGTMVLCRTGRYKKKMCQDRVRRKQVAYSNWLESILEEKSIRFYRKSGQHAYSEQGSASIVIQESQ